MSQYNVIQYNKNVKNKWIILPVAYLWSLVASDKYELGISHPVEVNIDKK